MTVYYLESSALVKRCVAETGTAWVRGLAAPAAGNTLFVSLIAGAEVVAAVALRLRRGYPAGCGGPKDNGRVR